MVPLRGLFHSFIGCIKKMIPHYQPAYIGCRAESKLSPGWKIRFDRSHVHNTNSPWSLYTYRPATCCSHRKNINGNQAHLYRIHHHENRASGYANFAGSSSPRPLRARWLRYADTFLNCPHRSKHAHTERKLPLRPCRTKETLRFWPEAQLRLPPGVEHTLSGSAAFLDSMRSLSFSARSFPPHISVHIFRAYFFGWP